LNFYLKNIIAIAYKKNFQGWGKKKTGKFASYCHNKLGGTLVLKEDGFIRSIELGINNAPSLSIIEDNTGIYYDATTTNQLESLLLNYNFKTNQTLMNTTKKAISLIKTHNISKYNNSKNINMNRFQSQKKKILIIAQTFGDCSLEYGLTQAYTTKDIINAAINENPDSEIYLKIHPDVLTGKKKSDIDIKNIDKKCKIITENINPI
jgi:capsular polysaccharide export protein